MRDIRDDSASATMASKLRRRRVALGMTVGQLARRSKVSTATVNRVLAGSAATSIAHVNSVAAALGVSLQLRPTGNMRSFRVRQAISKAKLAVGLTQASAALEGQGVSRQVAREVQKKLTRQLLASRFTLWE